MLQTDKTAIQIKIFYQNLRKLVNIISVLLAIFAFVYLLYYQMITNDQWHTFDDTKSIFLPLANFFFPNDTTDKVFLNTGFCLMGCAIPIIILYYALDIIKDYLIKICYKIQDQKNIRIAKELHRNELLQYDVIKHISVCLSLDWESENNLNQDAKTKLSNGIYQKLQSSLKSMRSVKNTHINRTFIITTDEFENFDSLFSVILKLLSKIKEQIETKNSIEMIPTITIAAYAQQEPFNTIEERHFDILGFNLQNKALSDNLFVKKYEHLGLKKYLGYSIGDYANFKDGKCDSIELHVIEQDLSEALSDKKNFEN